MERLLQQLSHAAVAALLGSFSWQSKRWDRALVRAAEYMLVQVVVPRRLAQAVKADSGNALLLELGSDWHSVEVQVA